MAKLFSRQRVATLIEETQALRERVSSPMTSDEQTYFDEQIHALHQRLDAQRFDRIWADGRTLTMEQALDFALGEEAE